jgi:transposase
MGACVGGVTGASGRCRNSGLGTAYVRWKRRARAPAFGRGKKSDPTSEAIGRSRGGVTTKIHVRVDGNGQPITFVLTPGETHESTQAQALLEQGSIKGRRRGRGRKRPTRLVADKAYGSRAFRRFLRRRGIRITLPRKSNERRRGSFDKSVYRQRNQVERFFNRLKQSRRIATRYEKRAVNYAAMITIAMILMWL